MAKSFIEKMQELAENVKLSAKGKEKKTFSRTDFEELYVSFLNENNYETKVASLKNGELVQETINPVAEFRKTFYNTLIDFGVDKQEAEKVLDGSYKFERAPGSYAFTSELLENYLKHKKFSFLPKEDFVGSIVMEKVEEEVKAFRKPGSDENGKKCVKRIKQHRKIKAKSSAPKWAKIEIRD